LAEQERAMRKGFLGSIAAVAAGAGAAWGQSPMPVPPAGGPPPPAAVGSTGVTPASGNTPSPVIMPPIQVGPPGDPQGLGPVGGFGPPPGPMYPMPGPYTAPVFQPATPGAQALNNMAPQIHAPHVWGTADYLLWFAKSQPVRFPLLTTSAPSDFGLLGRPSTLVLVGDRDLGYDTISGYRISLGAFLDTDRRFGGEVGGFQTETKSNITFYQSTQAGIPTLARPVIDSANVRLASSLLISNPNLGFGSVLVDTSTRTYGVEASGVVNLFRSVPGCMGRWACSVDFLAGYRYLELDEKLDISSATTLSVPNTNVPQFITGAFGVVTLVGNNAVPTPVNFAGVQIFSPATVEIRDSFHVRNQMNLFQVGLRGEIRRDWLSVLFSGKFAFGGNHEILEINGASGFSDQSRLGAGPAAALGTTIGGLLATSTNIGKFVNDEFVYVPEVNLSFGLNLTRSLTATAGYNFLYISKVARPGTQINPVVDTSTVPFSPNFGATNRPAGFRNLFAQDDFWLMGMNFGLDFRY
jgi:hypothetical protein